jgi:rod shape-determining protein MreC
MALYRRARSTRLLVGTLVLASLATITMDYRGGQGGPFETAGQALFNVVSPMQQAVSAVVRPVGNWVSGVFHIGSLSTENADLKAQLQQMQEQLDDTVALQQQVATLQGLLDLKSRSHYESMAAQVIAASVGNLQWTVTIDKGSNEGVTPDMPVITVQGLVGHVTEHVGANWSEVQLLIDPHSSVAARLSSSAETGLVEGQRDRDLKMSLVDNDATVNADDQVETAGFAGALYPAGIPIGVVSHVYQDPSSLSKLVTVRPLVDFSSLEFVLVITSSEVAATIPQVSPTPSPSIGGG